MVMVWRRMPRGMTFEQLMSQAAASGTPPFAPKSLPMDLPSRECSDEGGAGLERKRRRNLRPTLPPI